MDLCDLILILIMTPSVLLVGAYIVLAGGLFIELSERKKLSSN